MLISEVEKKTEDKTVVIDINNKIIRKEEAEPEKHGRVCVCRIPKSLSSGKPEAFRPEFVGLGPYHHSRSDLTMTDELKFAAANRVFNHAFQICVSDINPFYHADAFFCYNHNDQKLVLDMTLDGLFLLALLHRSAHAKPHQHSYFLTGKHGLPLVNALGEELTMDAVIRDVFMLENQIPTRVLQQVCSSKNEIQQEDNLGAKMESFCQIHCPLVKFEKLSKTAEEHDHLLDLMYHLIVQYGEDEKGEMDSGNNQDRSDDDFFSRLCFFFDIFSCMMCGCAGCCLEDPDDDKDKEGNSKKNSGNNTCCSGCYSMCFGCFNIWRCLVCLFSVFIWVAIFCVWDFIRLIPTFFMRAFLSLCDILKYMLRLTQPAVNRLYDNLSHCQNQNQFKSLALFVGGIKRASEELTADSTNIPDDVRPLVMIPSVTELHKAGIGFQPAQGGISSIKFEQGTSTFYLPRIKLDVNSEVIMRNLMVYESLSDSNRPLLFSRYIELMRAIIDTAQDVKLLVDKEIIMTGLSDEAVADLFNGMSKSIRATNSMDLEKEIKKVNAKFNDSHKVKRAMVRYVYSAGKFYTVVAALVFLALTAVQAYCSVYNCSATSQNERMPPPHGDYYSRNNYFISSF